MHISLLYPLLACGAPVEPPIAAQSQPDSRQPKQSDAVKALQWGELNFIHTTDTHGWLAGHILEREFSGDWGDFVSFNEHMQQLADDRGVDLVTVDTGDRHDGNGLSDASKHDGSLALPIFCEVDYDVVTIGNHELYRGVASVQEYHQIRQHYGDRYVVSNVEVAVGKTWVPMGEKYRVFTTKNRNLTVLALGFLFNFEGNDRHASRVTRVEDEIEKPWFTGLLQRMHEFDYVVLAGHIPPRGSPEFRTILHKIRSASKTIPVSMFGGHSHVRDYRLYDDRAVALQAGRYVETIGWASVNFTHAATPSFSRRYIDFNARNMALHAQKPPSQFQTERGARVSQAIADARRKLDLDQYRAYIPQNYYTDRAPFPSQNSIYTLLQEKVLPLLTSPAEIANSTRYILLNTGAVRFDLFKGPYTKDTGYILSPFQNQWMYIADVPRYVADQVLPLINGEDRVTARSRYTPLTWRQWARQAVSSVAALFSHESTIHEATMHDEAALHPERHLSAGYRTVDDLDDDGDDTVHEPWRFYPIPNALQTVVEAGNGPIAKTDRVSLVFHDFMASFVENALVHLHHHELFKPVYHGGEEVIDLVPAYLNSSTA